MCYYDDFIPINKFEKILKNEILEKYLSCKTFKKNINSIYSKLYINNINNSFYFNIINDIINSILKNEYDENEDIKLIHFKDDMLIVFVFNKITIKLYNYQKYKQKYIDKLYKILLNNLCNNLENIYSVNEYNFYNFVIVTSKTINTNIIPCDKLLIDIKLALHYLMKINWNHRDCLIDNIGYDVDKDCYVLFDFEKSRYTNDNDLLKKEYSRDIDSLYSSYRFRINYN